MIRTIRRPWLPLLALAGLAGLAAVAPATLLASSAPPAAGPATAAQAPCAGPLSANTEITDVVPIAPTRLDVLANDCVGVATASRPVTITQVKQGAYGSATTDGATITYDPRGCTTGDTDGFDVVGYTITDGATSKTGIAIIHLVRPGTAPLTSTAPRTDTPQVGFVAGSTIGSTVPLRVTWCGLTASGSSVRSYRLEQGTNAGATFPTVVTSATTATSSTRGATPGTSYAWRVRTTDSKGRVGGFATSLTSKVSLIQDTSSAIRYSSGWSTATGSSYSAKKEHFTSKSGATATLSVTNVRAVAIVSSKGSGRGSFNVYVDGARVTTTAISERATKSSYRHVLYVRGLTSGAGVSHTITVKAAGNGRIDLDAILALSGKRDQAITFTTAPAARYHGPAYAVGATSSSGLPVSVSVNPASWTVCSLSGGSVSFLRPGSCRIDASQPGDPTWNARAASQIFTVAPRPVGVTGITAADRDYDGTVAATLDTSAADLDSTVVAGDDVHLDTSSAAGAFADATAGTAKLVHVTGLALTGADAAKYVIVAPTAPADIEPLGLTASFTSPNRDYDGTTAATIDTCSLATAIAGDDVSCDATGATAAFADATAGTAKTVTASGFSLAGADAASYAIASVDTATADIDKAHQSVAFTTTPPSGAIIGDTYTPSASATSGLDVDLSIDPAAAGVCHLDAGVVTADAEGTCMVSADQPGDANHLPAAQQQQAFAVGTNLLGQTIAFDLSAVSATYGGNPVTVSATATSGLPVTFASLTTAVCTVSGSDVTSVAAGTCTIRASQTGNGTYAAAPNVDQSFTVARRPITVTAVADTKAADGTTASAGVPTITSGSLAAGDTGTWTQVFDTAAVGTGKTLTPSGTVAHGETNVAASYTIAFVPVTTGVITAASQSIAFDLSGVSATYGDSPFAIAATASSGLDVAFASQTPGVCTVSGTDLTIVAAGTCTIRASQPGDEIYDAAPDVDRSFSIAQRAITVTAVSDTKLVDGTTASAGVPTITTGSLAAGDTATWSQTFDTAAIGTGKTLTPAGTVAHGLTDVTASYAITFVPVTTGSITTGGTGQTIAFDLSAVSATYGGNPVTVSATATSGLPVTFASLTTAVCTVSGSDVTSVAAGTCTIRASQTGNGTYAAAPNVDQSFTVARRPITVTAVADTKAADGTTASAGVPTITSGSLAAGDTGTWTQVFDTAAVGTGKTLTPSGTVAHGETNVAASYTIAFVPVTTGVITPGAADVTTSTVTANPGSVKAGGADTATVTVKLFDRLGNALITSGGVVTVFADHGTVGTVTDIGNGTYTAVYTSDAFKGRVTISATLDGVAITQTASINQH